jgi:hypothetical protein
MTKNEREEASAAALIDIYSTLVVKMKKCFPNTLSHLVSLAHSYQLPSFFS